MPLVLLLGACTGSEPAPTAETPSAEGRLTLVYTGHGEGEIEPCG